MSLLTIGNPLTLVAGIIYALPSRKVSISVQQTGGTIETSNDGTTFAVITLDTDNSTELSAGFIRAVTTNAIVILKR